VRRGGRGGQSGNRHKVGQTEVHTHQFVEISLPLVALNINNFFYSGHQGRRGYIPNLKKGESAG